jgi:hypothetical protein
VGAVLCVLENLQGGQFSFIIVFLEEPSVKVNVGFQIWGFLGVKV